MEKKATSSASTGIWSEISARGPLTRRLLRTRPARLTSMMGKALAMRPQNRPASARARGVESGGSRRSSTASHRMHRATERSPSGGSVCTCAQS
jgi:hypothetical protein